MIALVVFALGLCVGSFLNSVIWRLEKKESVLEGRSHCPYCRHRLAWLDLIPLLSFAALGGRCRYCRKSISWQYPLVELAAAVLFLLIFNFHFSTPQENLLFPPGQVFKEFSISQFFNLLYLWSIASLLIAVFVYDLKHALIPDQLMYPGILVSSIWYLISGVHTRYEIHTLYAVFGAAAFFFALHAISKGKWLGFGDVKLSILMGLFLGWPNVLVALFLAFSLGALTGLALILLKQKTMKSEIPFGPFLVAGTFLALFFGRQIGDWYLALVLV